MSEHDEWKSSWLEELADHMPIEEILGQVAGACYDHLDQYDEDLDSVLCEPESFKILEEAFLYLYERYVLELDKETLLH